MTLWFHPLCAAYKRPQSVLDALGGVSGDVTAAAGTAQTEAASPDTPADATSTATAVAIPDRERLERAANASLAHRRLPRIDGAERAPSGQATCRHCREHIERDSWRIRIMFYEEGRFFPGGFIHLNCRTGYFETRDVLDQMLHFSPALPPEEREALARACADTTP